MKKLITRFLLWFFDMKPVPQRGIEIVDLIKERPSTRVDKIPSYRRSGRTTRIANDIIQLFFELKKNEKFTYNDHYLGSRSGDDNLRNIVERRLIEEHRLKQNEDFFSSYDKRGNILIKKF